MGTVVSLYKSLIGFVEKCGENFNEYDIQAKELTGKTEYGTANSRTKKKKVPFGEKRQVQPKVTARDKFKNNCFSVIIKKTPIRA